MPRSPLAPGCSLCYPTGYTTPTIDERGTEMTKTELIVLFITEVLGEKEVPLTGDSKLRKFVRTKNSRGERVSPGAYWYVGRNGSCRIGRTKANSQSLGENVKAKMIAEAKASRGLK